MSDYTRAKIHLLLALGLLLAALAAAGLWSRTHEVSLESAVETRARVSTADYVPASGAGKGYVRSGGYAVSYYFVVDGTKYTGDWFYETGAPTGGALKGKVGEIAYIQVHYSPDNPAWNVPVIAPGKGLQGNAERLTNPDYPRVLNVLFALACGWIFYAIYSLAQERPREIARLKRKQLSQAEAAERMLGS